MDFLTDSGAHQRKGIIVSSEILLNQEKLEG